MKLESELCVHRHTEILNFDGVNHVNSKDMFHELESTQVLEFGVSYMKYPEVNSLSLFLQVLAKVFNTKVVQGYSADVEFNQSGR